MQLGAAPSTPKNPSLAGARVLCLLDGRDLALGVGRAEAIVVGAATGSLDVPALAEVVAKSLRELDSARRMPLDEREHAVPCVR